MRVFALPSASSRIATVVARVLLTAFVLCVVPPPSSALAEDTAMSVGPSKIAVSLMQGDTYTETLRIENDSPNPMRVAFVPWNFAYDEQGELHEIPDKDAERFRGAAGWISPLEPMTIEPKTEATVPVTVNVPLDSTVGTHSAYMRVIGQPMTNIEDNQSLARVRYQLNALLLVVVQSPSESEKLSAGAKLVSFEGPDRFATDRSVPFTARIDNTGNVHLDLNGKVIIKDASGKLVETLPIEDRTLFPESLSSVVERWTRLPLFGKFTAQLVGTCSITDMTQDFESEPVEFWYVSRPLLYAVIAAMVLLVVARILFRKRFRIRLVRASDEASDAK